MATKRPEAADQPLTQADLLATLTQVGHALNLVCELPEWLEHGHLPKHPAHAAAESYAMNCRALCEFLWGRKDHRDIRAANYEPATALTVERPPSIQFTASTQAAHFSRARLGDPFPSMTYEERSKVRDRLLDAATEFAERLNDDDSRQLMTSHVAHARTLAAWPPPPTAGQDPQPWIDATAEVASD